MASIPPPHTNSLMTLIISNHDDQEEEESPYSTPIFRSRRTPSFSSESSLDSLFSNDNSYPPYSPSTPLKSKGIPFSWEQIPGLPKHQESKNKNKKEYSEHLLPPPPARNSYSHSAPKKSHHHPTNVVRSLQRDPFFAALVECSKDDDHHNKHDHEHHGTNFGNMVCSKITRTLSDRFGLMNLYAASCKRTCSVSESMVCLPRSSPHYLMHNRR